MNAPSRAAAVIGAVGLLSALVIWIVTPQTRLVFAVSPALLVVLMTLLVAVGCLAWGWLGRMKHALRADGDRRVARPPTPSRPGSGPSGVGCWAASITS